MVPLYSLAAYKNRPALVTGVGEKIDITLIRGETLRVREKDLEPLYPGPCSPADLEKTPPEADMRGIWELLENGLEPGASVPLQELAELAYGVFTPAGAWAAYKALREGIYFTGTVEAVFPREAAAVAADEEKRRLRQQEEGERQAFLEKLRSVLPGAGGKGASSPADPLICEKERHFFQDVEALAYGQTGKSRLLRELGRSETPQEAHRLLLAAGVWTPLVNPYPVRFGLPLNSPRCVLDPPPDEDRIDLTGLPAYAIDSPWSTDPDDAVSLEGNCLYVHIADPAASVLPASPADKEACGRGATLYLPETTCRMLPDEALAFYALGLSDTSPALTFKLTLNDDGAPADCEIFPSRLKVTRLSYEEADDCFELEGLFELADRNLKRRRTGRAVFIELPETHIMVKDGRISIEPIQEYRSAAMIRECMLLAGEGTARWAFQRRLPFPYVGQETGDLPGSSLPGLAGSYQLRRCMRPRVLSGKPAPHWGLGLEAYSQVTSPLRRYQDLLAHQQIRAFLAGRPPLGEEELLMALAAADAAALAVVQAERASRAHWIAVYLSERKNSSWEGVIVEQKGGRSVVMIPALGMETQINVQGELNGSLVLIPLSVKIPEGEVVFTEKYL